MTAVGKDFAHAIFRGHSDQAALSNPACRDLRGEVSLTLARGSDVRENHRHDVAYDAATIAHLSRRDTQPCMEHLARQANATGVRATNIGVVCAIGDVKRRARSPGD